MPHLSKVTAFISVCHRPPIKNAFDTIDRAPCVQRHVGSLTVSTSLGRGRRQDW